MNPTFATLWNADVIDETYARWQQDPASVDASWTAFFEGFALGANGSGLRPGQGGATATAGDGTPAAAATGGTASPLQARLTGAIYMYRNLGHTQADINPLRPPTPNPRLSPAKLGFSEADLDFVGDTGNFQGAGNLSVRELLRRLHATYCGPIGVEYLHLQDTGPRRWLQSRIEPTENQPQLTRDQEVRVLEHILEAELFESFLHTRFVGQKRFSLEGGETMIAALDAVIERCPDLGLKEVIVGMAHRGRLNVLVNFLGKKPSMLFTEFSENYLPDLTHGDGDVKYHLGYDSEVTTSSGGKVTLRLAANPSHLEAINPVVEGRARARQRIIGDLTRKQLLPVLIHGDAAFAGQGMVAETLNLSKLKGYTTGGTLHFVINNQIGFTTNPEQARSSRYCTDVAKMIEAPIFHVNGDNPAAVVHATLLALEFRQQFGSDVVIDMYCYRRHGHNESDEPRFTQPQLYGQLDKHPLISQTYSQRLLQQGVLQETDVEAMRVKYTAKLDEAFKAVKVAEDPTQIDRRTRFAGSTAVFQAPYSFAPVPTSTSAEALATITKCLTTVPEGFNANPKVVRVMQQRAAAMAADSGIDWGFAESLAWGALLLEGNPVRLSGQDVERGTFSHRHATLYDTQTGARHLLLEHLPGTKAWICVHNSLLSEAAVLGFDYGYSMDFPNMLVQWEGQFGDFVNGAQVIIDQFIASSESKWQRLSGIVLLLPHGYEGQGPEHSSARLERFLQLCAENNIQVGNLSTPAQYFHALRRQVKRDFRKPLILMTPKSLLRLKECQSPVRDFTHGQFEEMLADPATPASPKRVVMCSGKVYYDLLAHRTVHQIQDTAIVRIEQFYPFHGEKLAAILASYGKVEKFVWCQEEPENMGAWFFLRHRLRGLLGSEPLYAGRDAAASPAVGSLAVHKLEQAKLVHDAFSL